MKKLLMALAFLPLMAAAETWYDSKTGYTWTYGVYDSYEHPAEGIAIYDVAPKPKGVLTIPSHINGSPVRSVDQPWNVDPAVGFDWEGDEFLNHCPDLTKVIFPDTLIVIGPDMVRWCPKLTDAYLPEGLKEIGKYSFMDCGAITSIELPSTLEEDISHLWSDNSIAFASIRGGNNKHFFIEDGALYFRAVQDSDMFYSDVVTGEVELWGVCTSVRRLVVRETCKGIRARAARGRNALREVILPDGLTVSRGGFLKNCSQLRSVVIKGSAAAFDEWVNDGNDYYDGSPSVTTYVTHDKGWEEIVAMGTWQQRPIKFIEEYVPEVICGPFVPGGQVDFATGLIDYTASGLPSGLKYNKTTGMITGAATKPGEYVVKFTKSGAETEELTIVVGPMPKIDVVPEGDTDGCKVTGMGAYLVGKTVTLKVTAPKGTAFVGFFKDGEPWPNEADCKKTSLAYAMGKEDVSLVAKFEKEKMSVGCVGLSDGSFTAGVAGSPEGIPLEIETQSGVKSVKVEKLPAGMKYDAKNERITGAPTKAGNSKVVITVTAVSGAVEKKEIDVPVAAMSETAVGTFNGFVANDEQRIGTFSLTTTDAGKLTAKVITAAGTVSFSGTCWDSVEDGVYKVTLTTKKGERLSLTLDSNAAWDADQLSGAFTTALILAKGIEIPSQTYLLSAQRNAFGKTWYFTAVGDEQTGWTFAYTKDVKAAALTVTLKADGSTAVAGALPNGEDAKGKVVALKVSASGYANVGGMREGAIMTDFAPIVTVNKVKKVLSIHTNLWFDRSDDHDEGVGGAEFVE